MPQLRPAMGDDELNEVAVLRLAEHWYDNFGPYRGSYAMHATRAFKNSDTQWCVRGLDSFIAVLFSYLLLFPQVH